MDVNWAEDMTLVWFTISLIYEFSSSKVLLISFRRFPFEIPLLSKVSLNWTFVLYIYIASMIFSLFIWYWWSASVFSKNILIKAGMIESLTMINLFYPLRFPSIMYFIWLQMFYMFICLMMLFLTIDEVSG